MNKELLQKFIDYLNSQYIKLGKFLYDEKRKYFRLKYKPLMSDGSSIVAFIDKNTAIVYNSRTATAPSTRILFENLTREDLWHYLRDKLSN